MPFNYFSVNKSSLHFILAASLLVSVISFSCKEKSSTEPEAQQVITELEGKWAGVEISGAAGSWEFVVTGKNASLSSTYPVMWYRGNIVLDTADGFKTLDFNITSGWDAADIGTKSLGIYKISGDTLLFALANPGVTRRPSRFVGTFSTRVFSLQYKASVTPAVPEMLSPVNNDTGVAVTPTLRWSRVRGATGYSLQVSKTAAFDYLKYSNNSLTDTVMVISGLSAGTKYYWRVASNNSNGASPWSDPYFTFTTLR